MSNLRFSSTAGIIKDYVQYYIAANNLKTTLKNNRPGKNWLRKLLRHKNLSFKKANLISAARK